MITWWSNNEFWTWPIGGANSNNNDSLSATLIVGLAYHTFIKIIKMPLTSLGETLHQDPPPSSSSSSSKSDEGWTLAEHWVEQLFKCQKLFECVIGSTDLKRKKMTLTEDLLSLKCTRCCLWLTLAWLGCFLLLSEKGPEHGITAGGYILTFVCV